MPRILRSNPGSVTTEWTKMQAKETKLQDIIEGTKQYVVPLFQRSYSWDKKEWKALWDDLIELSEMENPRTHFIGSIVSLPTVSVPEGVSKFLLIDGQQRLTTILILLTLLKDSANENGDSNFADEIQNTLLVNQYKDNLDYYKLLPTQVDRDDFQNLINNKDLNEESQINLAYLFFKRKLARFPLENSILKKIITNYLSIVSIVLDKDDNPHLVFESLNAKGKPLTSADLIRNYFFMRIHIDKQQNVYDELWNPMENKLGNNLPEFIRHYLMRNGLVVKQTDVYYSLKEDIQTDDAIEYLRDLFTFSSYYEKLINPQLEKNYHLKKYIIRLNRIEVTTAYPLLLNFYSKLYKNVISENDFIELLKIIENYLIRRFVCGYATNQLNKIFPQVIKQLDERYTNNYVEGLKTILQTKGYPRDSEFIKRIIDSKLYGAGDRKTKTKLILESIEEHFGHKEQVPFQELTIEHIMPQNLSDWWKSYYGDNWALNQELNVHTIGNLTLTAYNSELSNSDFYTKKKAYANSHLGLNKYFETIENWNTEDIYKRAGNLAYKMVDIWPYFGSGDFVETEIDDVTGKTPKSLFIFNQHISVNSWRDVLVNTLDIIADLEPEKYNIIIKEYPDFLGIGRKTFRSSRKLKNGTLIEANHGANRIQGFCFNILDILDLSSEDLEIQLE